MASHIKRFVSKIFLAMGYRITRLHSPSVEELKRDDPFAAQRQILNQIKGTAIPVIFDLGANEGQTSHAYLDHLPNAQIHAFEPTPEMYGMLQKRFNGNDNIKLCPKAVSDTCGTISFHVHDNAHVFNSMLAQEDVSLVPAESKVISVPTVTIDSYCEDNKVTQIDVLKIDVQGAEMHVLRGSKNMLASGNIKLVFLEANFVSFYKNQAPFSHLSQYLFNAGFYCHGIYRAQMPSGILGWADVLFVHKSVNLGDQQ